ncbi:replication protein A 70 kDa DNA-binding subunit E-like [Rutidosis leptorrhynchoides]|uniref:replication protein A 70 kDa DNA-binding subunit E-like n=1 Tax=Rutidosis leptorrhynchoides TaxID=125765 RepID=UPI003A992530
MATVENFTPLNLITDQTNDWKICIRVHINWRKTYWKNPNNASSLEMILVDQQGFKIRATTDKQAMTFFGDTFKEGEHFVLSNFRVGKHDDDVKLIQHEFKIHLTRTSIVRKSPAFVIERDVFRVVSYDDICQMWRSKSNDIVDVVGKLVEMHPIRVTRSKGVDTKSLEFQLKDNSGQKIRCALWNGHATHLHEYVSALDDAMKAKVVVFIHNCKVKEWDGAPQDIREQIINNGKV